MYKSVESIGRIFEDFENAAELFETSCHFQFEIRPPSKKLYDDVPPPIRVR